MYTRCSTKGHTEERAWYLIAGVDVSGSGPELDGTVPWSEPIGDPFTELLEHDDWRLARGVGEPRKILDSYLIQSPTDSEKVGSLI